jgi:hypothetical protein
MIEFKPGRYIKLLVTYGFEGGDYLGCLFSDDKKTWTYTFRFRTYNDDKAFDSTDDKKWFSMDTVCDEETAKARVAVILLDFMKSFPDAADKMIVADLGTDDMSVIIDAMKSNPMFNIREEHIQNTNILGNKSVGSA